MYPHAEAVRLRSHLFFPLPKTGEPYVIAMSSDVLPEQFFSRPSLATLCPEAALMCAVLEDALDCVQKQFISETRRAKHLGQEAEQWLFSDDSNWAFSFVAICNALDLSPEYIRLKLKRCNEPRQDAAQNKRRLIETVQQRRVA